MMRRTTFLAAVLFFIAAPTPFALADDDKPAVPSAAELSVQQSSRGGWNLETLHLAEGKIRSGIVVSENDASLEFLEVVQPPGKPMYLVRLPAIDRRDVVRIERLPQDEREQLFRRIEQFAARARIESARMQDLNLERTSGERGAQWTYLGEWFLLQSSADEETTRRCAVRLQQVFGAYRQVLPPRAEGRAGLKILLFGSTDEYRGYLQRLGLEIRNPALYSAPQNLIVAGSDLTRYSEQIQQIRFENAEIRQQYETLESQFSEKLAEISRQLKAAGVSAEEIKNELTGRKTAWARQRDAHLKRIAEIERRNEARFDEAAGDMFRRLYHEAFHAYLENYVFPGDGRRLPRWLNEGLAQVFEDGQLDADTLRIDAPSRERLQRLQADMRNAPRLALAQLITAQDDAFLAAHDGETSERHYLYGWGLAYYLAFERDLLERERLDDYGSAASGAAAPIERFEQLVDAPLDRFERRWRTFILELTP